MRAWFVVFSIVLIGAVSAEAQDEDARNETARSLFRQGLEDGQAGRWAQAESRFARALGLRWSGQIAYNLAHARIELGELLGAVAVLNEVIESDEVDAQVREASETLRDEIQPRIANITVRMEGATEGVEITIDERPARVGVAQEVNPGPHRVVARLDGAVVGRASAELAEGESNSVVLSGLAPSAVAEDFQPVEDTRDDGSGSRLGLAVGVSLLAAAAVAAIVVVILLAPYGDPDVQPNWGDPIRVDVPESM